MNWDLSVRQWKQAQPAIKRQWALLTDDDLNNLGVKKADLVARIEERYGILEEEALIQVNEWLEKRSPIAEKTPYWVAIICGIALVALFSGFGLAPLPWGPVKYAGFAFLMIALMAIVFRRRRRLEF